MGMGGQILTLHDKAVPHSTAATVEEIGQLECELFPDPKRTGPISIGLSRV